MTWYFMYKGLVKILSEDKKNRKLSEQAIASYCKIFSGHNLLSATSSSAFLGAVMISKWRETKTSRVYKRKNVSIYKQ